MTLTDAYLILIATMAYLLIGARIWWLCTAGDFGRETVRNEIAWCVTCVVLWPVLLVVAWGVARVRM